jgi:hypothetical protein
VSASDCAADARDGVCVAGARSSRTSLPLPRSRCWLPSVGGGWLFHQLILAGYITQSRALPCMAGGSARCALAQALGSGEHVLGIRHYDATLFWIAVSIGPRSPPWLGYQVPLYSGGARNLSVPHRPGRARRGHDHPDILRSATKPAWPGSTGRSGLCPVGRRRNQCPHAIPLTGLRVIWGRALNLSYQTTLEG